MAGGGHLRSQRLAMSEAPDEAGALNKAAVKSQGAGHEADGNTARRIWFSKIQSR
jgi:hypothetical protein